MVGVGGGGASDENIRPPHVWARTRGKGPGPVIRRPSACSGSAPTNTPHKTSALRASHRPPDCAPVCPQKSNNVAKATDSTTSANALLRIVELCSMACRLKRVPTMRAGAGALRS